MSRAPKVERAAGRFGRARQVACAPPIERFHRICDLIAEKPMSARRIGEQLEISSKTIERDIEFMRDRLGLEIEATGLGYLLKSTGPRCIVCSGKKYSAERAAGRFGTSADRMSAARS